MIICSTTFPGKLPIQVPVLSFKKCFHINPVRKKEFETQVEIVYKLTSILTDETYILTLSRAAVND